MDNKVKLDRKQFPILGSGGAKIDWQLVADHGEQARKNHYQSVERLAERGGLAWSELYAVLHNKPWEKLDTNEAMIACRELESRYLSVLEPSPSPDMREAVEALKAARTQIMFWKATADKVPGHASSMPFIEPSSAAIDTIDAALRSLTGAKPVHLGCFRAVASDPMGLRGTCEDPRLIAAGYRVCGSNGDREWHWQGPDREWHDGYKSEERAVKAALAALTGAKP